MTNPNLDRKNETMTVDNQISNENADTTVQLTTAEEADILCTRLLKTTGELIAVLERETADLRKARIDEIAALTLKKQTLSATIARDSNILRANADFIKTVVPQRIDQLREQEGHFHKSLNTNHDALSAMKAVSEGLLQTVANSVQKQKSGPQTYGRNATYKNSTGNQVGSISVDTTL